MTIPIRKLIRPMMPSARTPTTSKRWITAFARKRFGRRMTFAKAIRVAPKKPSRPTSVSPVSTTHSPSSRRISDRAARFLGSDARRLVKLTDLLEEADFIVAGADYLCASVADSAVDEPRADSVHAIDFGKVDRQRIRGSPRSRARSSPPG